MDTWCKPMRAKNGLMVYGGAARNVRIAARGGMNNIIMEMAIRATEDAFKMANDAANRNWRIRRVK